MQTSRMCHTLHCRWPATAILAAIVVALAVAACNRGGATRDADSSANAAAGEIRTASGGVGLRLAAVRDATVRFQDFDAALAAGYDTKVTDCREDSHHGGMGYHYGNAAMFDTTLEVEAPEVLLYEPQQNGRLRLVAVEYIVPRPAWTAAEPPTLLGQVFRPNEEFDVWMLHVWVWKQNPSGIFADWNPMVSCEAAAD